MPLFPDILVTATRLHSRSLASLRTFVRAKKISDRERSGGDGSPSSRARAHVPPASPHRIDRDLARVLKTLQQHQPVTYQRHELPSKTGLRGGGGWGGGVACTIPRARSSAPSRTDARAYRYCLGTRRAPTFSSPVGDTTRQT